MGFKKSRETDCIGKRTVKEVDSEVSRKRKTRKKVLDKTRISRILRTVSRDEGFHFFRDLGDPTGMVATSLSEFVERMREVDIRSVDFHFKRQDFKNWIGDVTGDLELSRRLGRIRKGNHGEKLREKICQILETRLRELKET